MDKRELDYYYEMYLGIRNDRESGSGTALPYGLCKSAGIDVPDGTKPSEAWKLLRKKTGVSAKEGYSDIARHKNVVDVLRENNVNVKSENKTLSTHDINNEIQGCRDYIKEQKQYASQFKVASRMAKALRNAENGAEVTLKNSADSLNVSSGKYVKKGDIWYDETGCEALSSQLGAAMALVEFDEDFCKAEESVDKGEYKGVGDLLRTYGLMKPKGKR